VQDLPGAGGEVALSAAERTHERQPSARVTPGRLVTVGS
jgi:hypothetical protein